jgi:transposase
VTNLQTTVNQAIPVWFSEQEFDKFILPLLWVGKRGPKPGITLYQYFHYILYVLYTGIQWKSLPIELKLDGTPEIHYTRVWHKWKQWVEYGSIKELFYRSVQFLKDEGKLDISILNCDGSNTVAKKGGKV